MSIEEVLDHYGLLDKLKRRRDELTGRCPFPDHEDKRASFSANTTKNIFQCFTGSCGAKGNVLDFVAKMEGVDIREAGLLLQGWFQIVPEKPSGTASIAPERSQQPRSSIIQPEPTENTPLSFELKLDATHPYLRHRGLMTETIEYFGLGYAARGVMQRRIAIPIHDSQTGQLLAYCGRWADDEVPDEEVRYKMPEGFHKSQVVFNLHRAGELAGENKELIVTEGFFDCFSLWQGGFPNTVSLMGSSLSQRQKELLIECVGRQGKLTLLFDEDEAGDACRRQCLDELADYLFVKSLRLPAGVSQPDALTGEQIQQLFTPS